MSMYDFLTSSSAMAASFADHLPDLEKNLLFVLGIAITLATVLFLSIKFLSYRHRKAYNLTKIEQAKSGDVPDPAFRSVDHAERASAKERGDAYVRPADQVDTDDTTDEQAKKLSGWGRICSVAAIIAAIGHVGILVIAVMDHAKSADVVMEEFSTSDRIVTVLQKYWIGFTLAGLIIAAQLVLFIGRRKTND